MPPGARLGRGTWVADLCCMFRAIADEVVLSVFSFIFRVAVAVFKSSAARRPRHA